MEKILTFTIECYVLFFCLKCFVCQQVRNSQFKRNLVGYNSAMDNNKMEVAMKKSRLKCGSYCTEKGCTSFIYDSADRVCTLYSAYMVGGGPPISNYYATTEAVETINVVGTCQSVTHNSSFINVALGKSVTLSSVYGLGKASLLVNGVRDGKYPCAHTNLETNPYMMVDLAASYNVNSLYVLNRLDCCSDRLFNLKIELGVTTETMREYVYRDGLFNVFGSECTFVLDHIIVARYVKVSVVGQTYFTVCELGVYILS